MTTTEAPLWDEPQFAALAERLVADFAPRLFALFKEEGERLDGHIFAWGLEFKDHAEVVRECGTHHSGFPSAESAREKLSRHGKMLLIWYNPDAATSR